MLRFLTGFSRLRIFNSPRLHQLTPEGPGFLPRVFSGKRPLIPTRGAVIPTDHGDFWIVPGTELGPARSGKGYRFRWGPNEIRIMGPRPEPPYDAPNGYVVITNPSGQPIDPAT